MSTGRHHHPQGGETVMCDILHLVEEAQTSEAEDQREDEAISKTSSQVATRYYLYQQVENCLWFAYNWAVPSTHYFQSTFLSIFNY